jgi:hypothetical protein
MSKILVVYFSRTTAQAGSYNGATDVAPHRGICPL